VNHSATIPITCREMLGLGILFITNNDQLKPRSHPRLIQDTIYLKMINFIHKQVNSSINLLAQNLNLANLLLGDSYRC
jgi:hypothetical protein